jgi:hypothetical protein
MPQTTCKQKAQRARQGCDPKQMDATWKRDISQVTRSHRKCKEQQETDAWGVSGRGCKPHRAVSFMLGVRSPLSVWRHQTLAVMNVR